MLTAYTDASLRDNKGGIGFLIIKGNEIIYSCRKESNASNIYVLECLSLIELLRYINRTELKNVTVFTDHKNIVNSIDAGKNNDRYIDQILHELSLNPTINVKWINRKFNKKAHKLSREIIEGYGNKEFNEPINNFIKKREKYELKMVIKHRKYMILKCPVCKEHKLASEFPREFFNHKQRKCKRCQNMIEFFESPLIKVNYDKK